VKHTRRVVIVVRPGRRPGRLQAVARWVRSFAPAALLLVAPAVLPEGVDAADIITLDADDADLGPLSLADALARRGVPRERA